MTHRQQQDPDRGGWPAPTIFGWTLFAGICVMAAAVVVLVFSP